MAPSDIDPPTPFDDIGYTLFETPIGRCGVAWRGEVIVAAKLPEPEDSATERRLLSRFDPAMQKTAVRFEADDADLAPIARRAIDQLRAMMAGAPSDLASLPVDMADVPDFHRRVYDLSRRIPPGHTLTYGEVAQRLNEPGAARAVGQALGHNPFAPIVPCHRILAAGGRGGGFSATGGVRTKLRLLSLESLTPGEDTPALSVPPSPDSPQRGREDPGDDLFGWRV